MVSWRLGPQPEDCSGPLIQGETMNLHAGPTWIVCREIRVGCEGGKNQAGMRLEHRITLSRLSCSQDSTLSNSIKAKIVHDQKWLEYFVVTNVLSVPLVETHPAIS